MNDAGQSPHCQPPVLSYAAPPHDPGALRVWRSGDFVEMYFDAHLPDRCVKCNQVTNLAPLRLELDWVDPRIAEKYQKWWRWLPGMRFMAGLARAAEEARERETVVISYPLCARQRRQRLYAKTLQIISLTGALVALTFSPFLDNIWPPIGAAVVMMAICLALVPLATPPLSAEQIRKPFVTIKGFCPTYVQELPAGSAPQPVSPAALAAASKEMTDRLRRARPGKASRS